MSKLFSNALLLQVVTLNPTAGVKVPGKNKIKRRPKKPMLPEEARHFLDEAGSTPWLALWALALSSGMRPGEYLGLPWSCVDWERNTVRVKQAVRRPRKQKPLLGAPKNKNSYRSIPVPPWVMDELRDYRLAQNQHRLRVGESWDSSLDLVFPNDHGGIWDESNFVKTAFKPVLKASSLEGYSPYSLRHTCATLLLLQNIPAKVVSERLGHSRVSQTLDTYSHVLPTMQRAATESLSELLFQTS